MKNTNSKEYKEKVKAYLLPIIEEKAEDYGQSNNKPFNWMIQTAKNEIGHEFERHGLQGGLTEYLAGLGLNIDFYYSDILKRAADWHEVEKFTEKEEDKICRDWFKHIAFKIIQFAEQENK